MIYLHFFRDTFIYFVLITTAHLIDDHYIALLHLQDDYIAAHPILININMT